MIDKIPSPLSWEREVRDPDFIGGFFPRGHVSLVASRPGVGKTFFCIWLLASLSVKGKKCVYFAGEAGADLVFQRFKNLAVPYKKENIFIYTYTGLSDTGVVPSLETSDGVELLQSICLKIRPDIIIFDSLLSFRDGDENSAKETNVLMRNARQIAILNDSAVLCTHHLRKKDKKNSGVNDSLLIDQDEIIGSSSFTRNASVCFILVQQGLSVRCLKNVKTWWEKPAEFRYTMEKNDNGKIYFETDVYSNTSTAIDKIKVVTFLQSHAPLRFTPMKLANEVGVPTATVFSAMLDLGIIKQGETGFDKGIYSYK